MGVLKGFRKYNRTLLAIFTAALMVSFLVFPTMKGCGGDPSHEAVGNILDRNVSQGDVRGARFRWEQVYRLYVHSMQKFLAGSNPAGAGLAKTVDPTPLLQTALQAWRPCTAVEMSIATTMQMISSPRVYEFAKAFAGTAPDIVRNAGFVPLSDIQNALDYGGAVVFSPHNAAMIRFEPTSEEVMLRFGKAELARRQGIVVTDRDIDDYVAQLGFTDAELQVFAEKPRLATAADPHPVTMKYSEMREAIREELMILGHMAGLLSEVQVTEPQLLRHLRNTGDRIRLNVVELDARKYAPKVLASLDESKIEAELKALYEKHKNTVGRRAPEVDVSEHFPTSQEPDVIGYKRPDRVQIEVLEIPDADLKRLNELAKFRLGQLTPEQKRDLEARAEEYYRANSAAFPPPPEFRPVVPPTSDPAHPVVPMPPQGNPADPKGEPKKAAEPKKGDEPKKAADSKTDPMKSAPKKDEQPAEKKPEAKPEGKPGAALPAPGGSGLFGAPVFVPEAEEAAAESDAPKAAVKDETPKTGENRVEASKKDETKKEPAKKDEPKKDEPKKDEPKKGEPKKDEPKKDEPKKDEPKKDEPKKDEPKKGEPKKDQAKKDAVDAKKGGDGAATMPPEDPAAREEREFKERFAKVREDVMLRVLIEDMINKTVQEQTDPAYRRFAARNGGAEPTKRVEPGTDVHPLTGPVAPAVAIPNLGGGRTDRKPLSELSVLDALEQEYRIHALPARSGLISQAELREIPIDKTVLLNLLGARLTPLKKGETALSATDAIFRTPLLAAAKKARRPATAAAPAEPDEPRAFKIGQVGPALRGDGGQLFLVRILAAEPERVPAFEEVREQVLEDYSVEKAYDNLVGVEGQTQGEAYKMARALETGGAEAVKLPRVRTSGPFGLGQVANLDRLKADAIAESNAPAQPGERMPRSAGMARYFRTLQTLVGEAAGPAADKEYAARYAGSKDPALSVVPRAAIAQNYALSALTSGSRIRLNAKNRDDALPVFVQTPDDLAFGAFFMLPDLPAERRQELMKRGFRLLEENPKGVGVFPIKEQNRVLLFSIENYSAPPLTTKQREESQREARSLAVQEVLRDYGDRFRLAEMQRWPEDKRKEMAVRVRDEMKERR